MRLFEAILHANRRPGPDRKAPPLDVPLFRDSLPLAALTCIDARLNPLMPGVLGVPESEFIWLRNAGNIIFGPTSAMMRSLSLACAIKGAKEIAVIGHTDCLVCKTSVLTLTDKLKALGIERSKLPDDLVEFFGLFASERQNVMKACETIRSSPLIGAKIPVHGLLVDTESGRLEWVVNGYETVATVSSPVAVGAAHVPVGAAASESAAAPGPSPLPPMAEFDIGEMKFPELPPMAGFDIGELKSPETKIGELAGDVQRTLGTAEKMMAELKQRDLRPAWQTAKDLAAEVKETARDAREAAQQVRQTAREFKDMTPAERMAMLSRGLDKAKRFHIIGSNQKQYGPISGAKLLEWLADDRIGPDTAVQMEGSKTWQKVGQLAQSALHKPPPIGDAEHRLRKP